MDKALRDRICKILLQLDADNDEHWTADRVPAMATIHEIAGDTTITRTLLINAAPVFSRDNMTFVLPPERDKESDDEKRNEAPAQTSKEDAQTGAENSAPSEPSSQDEIADGVSDESKSDDSGDTISDEPEQAEVIVSCEQYDATIDLMRSQITYLQQTEAKARAEYLQIEQEADKLIAERNKVYPQKNASQEYQEHLARKKAHRERAAVERVNAPLVPAIPETPMSALDKSLRQQGHGMGKPNYHPQGAAK